MQPEFYEYLRIIGLTGALVERVESIHKFYSDILKMPIEDIFVTDYIDREGTRRYESLWLFSASFCMEAKSFLTQDNFDMAELQNHVRYSRIEKTEYDFIEANDKSRLSIYVNTDREVSCEFKASKENCEFLGRIFLTKLLVTPTQ